MRNISIDESPETATTMYCLLDERDAALVTTALLADAMDGSEEVCTFVDQTIPQSIHTERGESPTSFEFSKDDTPIIIGSLTSYAERVALRPLKLVRTVSLIGRIAVATKSTHSSCN